MPSSNHIFSLPISALRLIQEKFLLLTARTVIEQGTEVEDGSLYFAASNWDIHSLF